MSEKRRRLSSYDYLVDEDGTPSVNAARSRVVELQRKCGIELPITIRKLQEILEPDYRFKPIPATAVEQAFHREYSKYPSPSPYGSGYLNAYQAITVMTFQVYRTFIENPIRILRTDIVSQLIECPDNLILLATTIGCGKTTILDMVSERFTSDPKNSGKKVLSLSGRMLEIYGGRGEMVGTGNYAGPNPLQNISDEYGLVLVDDSHYLTHSYLSKSIAHIKAKQHCKFIFSGTFTPVYASDKIDSLFETKYSWEHVRLSKEELYQYCADLFAFTRSIFPEDTPLSWLVPYVLHVSADTGHQIGLTHKIVLYSLQRFTTLCMGERSWIESLGLSGVNDYGHSWQRTDLIDRKVLVEMQAFYAYHLPSTYSLSRFNLEGGCLGSVWPPAAVTILRSMLSGHRFPIVTKQNEADIRASGSIAANKDLDGLINLARRVAIFENTTTGTYDFFSDFSRRFYYRRAYPARIKTSHFIRLGFSNIDIYIHGVVSSLDFDVFFEPNTNTQHSHFNTSAGTNFQHAVFGRALELLPSGFSVTTEVLHAFGAARKPGHLDLWVNTPMRWGIELSVNYDIGHTNDPTPKPKPDTILDRLEHFRKGRKHGLFVADDFRLMVFISVDQPPQHQQYGASKSSGSRRIRTATIADSGSTPVAPPVTTDRQNAKTTPTDLAISTFGIGELDASTSYPVVPYSQAIVSELYADGARPKCTPVRRRSLERQLEDSYPQHIQLCKYQSDLTLVFVSKEHRDGVIVHADRQEYVTFNNSKLQSIIQEFRD